MYNLSSFINNFVCFFLDEIQKWLGLTPDETKNWKCKDLDELYNKIENLK